MKTRIKILFRALTQRNVILIYSKRISGDIEAKVITDTRFTVEEDKTILLSAASKLSTDTEILNQNSTIEEIWNVAKKCGITKEELDKYIKTLTNNK